MDYNETIASKNFSKRELTKFKEIVEDIQPQNRELIGILSNFINFVPDVQTLNIMDKTITALFESLEYPTEEWAIEDRQNLLGYNYAKRCIIEYCLTKTKDIDIIVDNVALLYNANTDEVEKSIISFMTTYGNQVKINNAFKQYSTNLNRDIRNYNKPEGFIPVFSKAVVSKIKEFNPSYQDRKLP